MHHYETIAEAIKYINDHYTEQPSLDDIAAAVHLSPFHFQRLFKEWAGVSPKKFLQYISLQHAKTLLEKNYTLEDATFETGLSGTSRLHDMFVNMEAMTPGEYKNGGESLRIKCTFTITQFGMVFIAATDKGVCNIQFTDSFENSLAELRAQWPKAQITVGESPILKNVKQFFTERNETVKDLRLHVKATPFQLKVWEALLKIPCGQVSTYGQIAESIQHPKASRAVGTAVGDNPIAYLIPCHRVIRSTGILGGYHWGKERKTAILGWEAAKVIGEKAAI
jgi:AraC family transcriptional regulator of adaptative response/methylated-DNA-[protein]-cysteine methyltransferase